MANYTETFKLPSKGRFYDNVGEDITLRAITTKDEKFIFGSNGDFALNTIIKNCIMSPAGIDIDKLLIQDKHFILVKLRIISYGSDYDIKFDCPECGKRKIPHKVVLDKLGTNFIKDELDEPFKIVLPQSKDELELKLLRGEDYDIAERKATKLEKKLTEASGDLEFIFRRMQQIVTVNGNTLEPGPKQQYVEEMSGMDSAFIASFFDSIEFGIDDTIQIKCPKCGEDIEVRMPINEYFFRPKFQHS